MGYFKHETAVVETERIGDETKLWHFVHVREGAVIGKGCTIGKGVYIDKDVVIGDRVKIQNFVSLYKGVSIEDDVFIGPSVTFMNDMYPRASRWSDAYIVPTVVRKGASLGANSTILCGIEVGEQAMVGAGSVVTKNVPCFGLVVGNPARLEGFVCYCGMKLDKVIEEDDEKIVYECRNKTCRKKVTINKEVEK